MFDTKNRIVKRQKVRCSAEGKIYATLPIADDIIDGTYYIRGYTQFMRNLNKNSYPNIQIYIGREHEAERKDTAVCAMFFRREDILCVANCKICAFTCLMPR